MMRSSKNNNGLVSPISAKNDPGFTLIILMDLKPV